MCSYCRFGSYEAELQLYSASTGFEQLSAPSVFTLIKQHSFGKLILPQHFQAIQSTLSVFHTHTDKVLVNKFYEPLWRTNEAYRQRLVALHPRLNRSLDSSVTAMESEDLLVLGILLSNSTPTEKATYLFQVFDEGCSGALDLNAVRDMLDKMMYLALERLPGLLRQEERNEDLGKYILKVMDNRSKAVTAALQIVMKTSLSVTQQGFLPRMALYRGGCLTSPAGLRRFAHDLRVNE